MKMFAFSILVFTLGACAHGPQKLADKNMDPQNVAVGEQTPADIGAGLMDRLKQQKDVVERRQYMIAENITQMKQQKQHLEREQALMDNQARAFGYPVWVSSSTGFRRAGTSLPATIYKLDQQIQSSELELMNLQNPAPVLSAN